MRRSALVVALVLVLTALGLPASATHDPIQTLKGEPFGTGDDVAVGLDSNGKATAAWTETGQTFVSIRPEGGHFGPPVTIIDAYASDIAFDESDNGNAVLATSGGMTEGRLGVSVRLGGNAAFSDPEFLLDPNAESAFNMDAAISDSGIAVVTWESQGVLYASISNASGDFGPVTQIQTVTTSLSASVDLDDSGDGVIAYDYHPAPAVDEIHAVPITNGTFGSPVVLDVMGQGPGFPDVAVNGRGDAVIVWVDFTEDDNSCGTNCSSRDVLEAVYGDVTGTFGPTQEITDPDAPTGVGDHEAALDDAGVAALLFNLTVSSQSGMHASVSDAAGNFAQRTFQTVSPHELAGGPGIAERHFHIAAGGGGFTAFFSNDHDQDGVNESWYSSSSAGTFGSPHQISPDSEEDAFRSIGDRNPAGQFIAGWQIYIDGSNTSIQVGPVAAGNPPVFGTDGDDDLTGTAEDDTAFLAGGNDSYDGAGGDDEVFGQAGNDEIKGASGLDRLIGGGGKDKLNGGSGKDFLNGGPGQDVCHKTKGDRLKSCEKIVERRHI